MEGVTALLQSLKVTNETYSISNIYNFIFAFGVSKHANRNNKIACI